MKLNKLKVMVGMAALLMAACQTPVKSIPPANLAVTPAPTVVQPAPAPIPSACVSVPMASVKPVVVAPTYMPSKWEMLPNWSTLDLAPSWPALRQSCRALKNKPAWQSICGLAEQVNLNDSAAQHAFYETWFTPYQVFNADGSEQGLITGYYEPLLKGSRQKSDKYRYPIYGVPEDLLEVDLSEVYPQLKGMRLRGKLQGRKLVPYYNRAEIDAGLNNFKGRELLWAENAVDLFFLQIQGSGRIELEDGSQVKIGYADQNGHPYISIGKKLIEMGELKPEETSMQGIKNWADKNPERLTALLGTNPSFVFFRELPDALPAPLGALGVPLTNEYSIAVDPRTIPLGAPVFLSTTLPNSSEPLNRLMHAQDTGGAIKGAVRADFFWGFGELAGTQAGRMKQAGRLWVLFPKGAEPALN